MKRLLYLIAALALPATMMADSFTAYWKQVREARRKDLPKTEISALDQIIAKAGREKAYGHLLKAQLMRASAQSNISPDSAEAEIQRLEQREAKATDPVLKAVYASVLGRLYKEHSESNEDARKSKAWYKASLADPPLLARQQSTGYSPAIVAGGDSKAFYDDLLHVIGMEAGDYRTLYDYYAKAGNRTAACLCAVEGLRQTRPGYIRHARKSPYLQRVDSLLKVYGDLSEAGELAVEHYDVMAGAEDVTAEDKVNFINYALSRWGAWPRMNVLRNALSGLQQPSFNINIGDYMLLPNRPRRMAINSITNIPELTLSVYRVRVDGNTQFDPSDSRDYAKLKGLMEPEPVETVTRRYIGLPAWKESTDTLTIKGLPVGVYLVEATTSVDNIEPQRQLLRVSNLFVMRQGLPDKTTRFVVVNATTGEPVQGAHLVLTTRGRSYNKTADTKEDFTTDKNGEVDYTYKEISADRVWAYTDADRACGEFSAYSSYGYWQNGSRKQGRIQAFTDRSLYRPGQTVHVAAWAWSSNADSLTSKAMQGAEVKFTLRDANYKEVAEKTATTDAYGTASADFVLPAQGLTGLFSITAGLGECSTQASFSVEQYKRPTFQVTFDKYKDAYHAGDTLSLRGVATTYSGVPVQGAKVAYTVSRRRGLWWFRQLAENSRLEADSTVTAADGSFTVRVPMAFPDDADLNGAAYYNFSVNARVADASGETHEGTATLPLSNRTGFLTTDLPDKALQDSVRTITFTYKNLSGELVDGTVRYRLDDGEWLTAKAQQPTPVTHKFASGLHRLEAVCGQDSLKKDIVVFSLGDKHPATETHDWYYLSSAQFPADGKPVYLQVGTSDKDVEVYYAILSGQKVIARGSRTFSNEVYTRKIIYKKEFGDGLTISQAWVVRGKLYTHTSQITRPVPDHRLKLTWKTFRDKLTPGQKETWTLQVAAPGGKPARAQLLASMYDKSLDAIRPHSWSFSNSYPLATPSTSWMGGSNAAIGLYGYQPYSALRDPSLSFSHFDPDIFGWWFEPLDEVRLFGGNRMYKHARLARAETAPVAMMAKQEVASDSPAEAAFALSDLGTHTAETQAGDAATGAAAQLRENLNETAFFYPALTTDAEGNVNIKFTLPESVTTWRFMGLAHDAAFNYGQTEAEAVASKAVMVQPHMPRFLREGDQAVLATRIFNTTDRAQSGTARLQIIDPETEKVLLEVSKPFAIEANGATASTFDVNTSRLAELAGGQTLLVARVLAEGRGFSDGEQHYLPLLPDREQVIHTIPFTQNGAGAKTIDLTSLFPAGSKDRSLTVEYTNNPAWLVIQALPTLASPSEDNAISLAAAIYANTLGRRILTSSPKIGKTVNLWQQETGGDASLRSNLERNQALKTMLLEETPWVWNASREADQKRQLAGFLDASAIDYRLADFTGKLERLQNADGSFSWWQGMEGNTYMTMTVVKMLARLQTMAGGQTGYASLLSSAFAFLDKEIAKEVSDLKKQERKGLKRLSPSETACDYLYASALVGRKPTPDMDYLVALLDKQPTELTIYGKANAAVILALYGKTGHAAEYLQSIHEYSVYTAERGRYFDTRKAQYSWMDYRIPTQVAAIEAMKRLCPKDRATIEDMQRWLLTEKRATSWENPLVSVDAVYAFLTDDKGGGSMATLATEDASILKLDGKPISLPKATAGVGYVKTNVANTDAKALTVEKTSTGTSWGAVYGQFLLKGTDVASASSGLTVKREVLRDGGSLNSLPLKVGDKVTVRITVVADRDYDFVQVEDKRAACLEPANQLSGYRGGYYVAPLDNATRYYFNRLGKGRHTIETEYYIDQEGDYAAGLCTAQCAYAPEYMGREAAQKLTAVKH